MGRSTDEQQIKLLCCFFVDLHMVFFLSGKRPHNKWRSYYMKLGKKGKSAIVIGVAAAVLLGGGLAVRGAVTKRAAAASEAATETVTLRKMDLTQSISVSGVVETAQTTNIYSTLNYAVKEIFVEVGDAV